LVSREDPPVFLEYPKQTKKPQLGGNESDPTHSAMYGIGLREKCQELGVKCSLVFPGSGEVGDVEFANSQEFLIKHLTDR
jgi:hypothetical protein